MSAILSNTICLTSTWFIRPGCENDALAALEQLAAEVCQQEPDTLMYRVHTPFVGDRRVQSLPPLDPRAVVFVEEYRDVDAFLAHVNGPVFTGFVRGSGGLFVASHGQPFTFVHFLSLRAGFARAPATAAAVPGSGSQPANRHPSGMFEVIAKEQGRLKDFYTKVFGWQYQIGAGGFAYVHFADPGAAGLGGIGQADPSIPRYTPGCNFYLLVADLDATIAAAEAAGGARRMACASVDGYQFAMIADPEGNAIGLLKQLASA